MQAQLDAYDGGIAYLDQELGLLYDELRERDILGDTLVVITSDHGEMFGEHQLYGHGSSLHRPQLHVPLLMLFPTRIPAGANG